MFSTTQLRYVAISAKFRAPMIKFRYGPGRDKASSAAATHSGATHKQHSASEVLYDFQLPQRLRRKPLDQQEIDAINSGGAM